MNNKKSLPFPLLIITIVLGVTIFKEFDVETGTFENPALAVVYVITFALSVYAMVNSYRKK